jgi:hypothetical protein
MASDAMKSVVTEDEVLSSINTHNISEEDLKFDKDSLNDIAKKLKE